MTSVPHKVTKKPPGKLYGTGSEHPWIIDEKANFKWSTEIYGADLPISKLFRNASPTLALAQPISGVTLTSMLPIVAVNQVQVTQSYTNRCPVNFTTLTRDVLVLAMRKELC